MRDEFLKIKSQLEADNAQIGRQISLLDQKIAYCVSKRTNLSNQIQDLKSTGDGDTDENELKKQQTATKKLIKDKEAELSILSKNFSSAKEKYS